MTGGGVSASERGGKGSWIFGEFLFGFGGG